MQERHPENVPQEGDGGLIRISGSIESVIYSNEDNGYAICDMGTDDGDEMITIVGTLIAMVCIIFIVLLFSMLLTKLVSLVSNIVTEIQYRM